MPLDNNVLQLLKDDYGFPGLSRSWSRIDDYSEYLSCQKWIRRRFSDIPLDVEFRSWMNYKILSSDKKLIQPREGEVKVNKQIVSGNAGMIGPYQRDRIMLCSADAGPPSQKQTACEAAYFFPGGKWVGAVRNSAHELECAFTILTSTYGMVNSHDIIGPYDLRAENNEEEVSLQWNSTVPNIMRRNQYDILVFYAGAVPRDPILKLLLPILRDLKIDFITFGRPNMFDVGKVKAIVSLLEEGSTFNQLQSVLKRPERLKFVAWNR